MGLNNQKECIKNNRMDMWLLVSKPPVAYVQLLVDDFSWLNVPDGILKFSLADL